MIAAARALADLVVPHPAGRARVPDARRLHYVRVGRREDDRSDDAERRVRIECAPERCMVPETSLTEVSPVLKSPEELAHGAPLLLDVTKDARVLVDMAGTLIPEP